MEEIKSFLLSSKGKDFLVILIVIFTGISSFGLGRLSKDSTSSGLKIDYKGQGTDILAQIGNLSTIEGIPQNKPKNSVGEYFASSRGKKYYPVNCSAGKSIKQENRIYFQSASEAEQAGYELSSSCD